MTDNISYTSFSTSDLKWFSKKSGDYNPIHINKEEARRLVSGEIIVPGMFLLLRALNFASEFTKNKISSIIVSFHNAALVDTKLKIIFRKKNLNGLLNINSINENIASIKVTYTDEVFKNSIHKRNSPVIKLKKNSFEELEGKFGSSIVYLSKDLKREFRKLVNSKQLNVISSLMTFSRIVGMEVPGLNSLFVGLNVKFSDNFKKKIYWKVVRHTNIRSLIILNVLGNGVEGQLKTIYRNTPILQPDIESIYKIHRSSELINKTALIIGGSRGLGEYSAKIIASKGAHVLITYYNGKKDANNIKNEIIKKGLKCDIYEMNVLKPDKILNKLKRKGFLITDLYYFASPKIKSSRKSNLNMLLFNQYNLVYVEAFEELIKKMYKLNFKSFRVFYPSTIYIDENPLIFKEYIKAKIKAERKMKSIKTEYRINDIFIPRLPKLFTDQNPYLSFQEIEKNRKIFLEYLFAYNQIEKKKYVK